MPPKKKKPPAPDTEDAPSQSQSAKESKGKGKRKGRPPATKKSKKSDPILPAPSSEEGEAEDLHPEEEEGGEQQVGSDESEQPEQPEQQDARILVIEQKKAYKKKQAPRQVYRINDQKVEEEILEWMQAEENDFLWNTIRTDYRCPHKKKTKYAEKEKMMSANKDLGMEVPGKYL